MTEHQKKFEDGSPSALQLLRHRIARDLKSGELEHGDRLPSVREVAEELAADPRTILSAYQQLVEEGLVEIRSRSGVFATGAFTSTGSAPGVPRRWMLDMLLGAIERDIPARWLADQIRSALVTSRARVGLLECNDDQLISMREELETYFGLDAIPIRLESIVPGRPNRELRDVDFLVSGGHAEIVARVAEELGKPYVITSVRPALLNRLSRLLSRGAVYFLVSDPRFGVKMRRLVAPMPRSENLHVLVVGKDDLGVIPEGAPTYVMRSVQARLAQQKHRWREVTPQRIFSEESIREILARLLALTDRAAEP
ncbi:MAG: GntR family transcriptional regulator [Gemmatimonadota bacterium]